MMNIKGMIYSVYTAFIMRVTNCHIIVELAKSGRQYNGIFEITEDFVTARL